MALPATADLRFRDIGPVEVDRAETPLPLSGRRLTSILAVLLINVNQRVSVDTLIDAVWGDHVPSGPEATLQSHLLRLRRLLEADHTRGTRFTTLVHDTGGFRLAARPEQVDSLVFEEAASAVRDLLLAERPDRALARADQALQLWRGRPWTPHSDEPWAAAATARLEELRAQLRERRVDCLLAAGDVDHAVLDLDVLVADYPLREHAWAQRMVATYRAGRTDEALATFQRARSILVDEVGVEPGPELRELQARILAGDAGSTGVPDPQWRSRTRAATDEGAPTDGLQPIGARSEVVVQLPRRRSPLLGRDRELDMLRTMLVAQPLVTVVGPPGCGKTRLTIEAARASLEYFGDGVWFVELSAAEDRAGLITTIASVLGLDTPEAGTAEQALQAFVRNRRMLLVLDGCGVTSDVADVVDHLLDSTELTVMLTSSQPLGVEGEQVFVLDPLPLPDLAPDRADPDQLATNPGVELFAQRAAGLGAGVERSELPVVAAICQALDGVPLAIELAAALTRSFTPAEILHRVQVDASGLVRVGGPGAAESTLADVIEQSVSALPIALRDLHQAVSVIPGAFTADVAGRVAQVPFNVARDAISGLVRRSLLVPLGARTGGAASRFQQLAPIRSHAHRTSAQIELERSARQRDVWVVELARDLPRVGNPEEPAWHRRLDDDLASVRATLQRCLVDHPDPAGAYVAARLGLYWYYRGMVIEWQRWSQLAVDSGAADPFDRVLADLSLACAVGIAGRSDLSAGHVDAADAFPVGDLDRDQEILLGEYYFAVANTSRATRDLELGRRASDAVRRFADRTGDGVLRLLADIASILGQVATGDPAALLADANATYARAVAADNDYAAWSAATVGSVAAIRARDPGVGLVWSDRAIAHHLRIGVGEAAGPLTLRGSLLAIAGRHEAAATIFAAARAQARRGGQRWPRTEKTWDLVSLAERHLTAAQRDEAERQGRTLELSQIDLDPASVSAAIRRVDH